MLGFNGSYYESITSMCLNDTMGQTMDTNSFLTEEPVDISALPTSKTLFYVIYL